MTVGNIMALRQTDVKRVGIFRYFSCCFMLMTLLSLSSGSLLLYYTAYSLSGIAALV
jgi:NADH:ubiquinone oxidoreductase subunit 2 (subunit N)